MVDQVQNASDLLERAAVSEEIKDMGRRGDLQTQWFRDLIVSLLGPGSDISVGSGGGPATSGRAIFASGQWGYWSANNSGSSVSAAGIMSSANITDVSSGVGDSSDGFFLRQDTGAVIDSEAFVRATNQNRYRGEHDPLVTIKWRMTDTSDIRFFSGLSDIAVLGSDDPAFNSYGIQYSTSRADSNFQFMVDDGTTQTLADSGVLADTNAHFTKIERDVSGIKISLLDTDFVEQASNTFTTNLPTGTLAHSVFSGIRTLAATVKSIEQFYASIVLRAV